MARADGFPARPTSDGDFAAGGDKGTAANAMPSRLRMVAAASGRAIPATNKPLGRSNPARSKIHMQTTEDLASHSTQLHQTGSGIAGDNI